MTKDSNLRQKSLVENRESRVSHYNIMITLLASYLVAWFGLNTINAQKIVKYTLIVIGVILALVLIFSIKSCFTKEPKIDQEAIQKINSENERVRKEELKQVIEKNSDVIKTVDERTVIAETSVAERDKVINQKIAEVDKKVEEIKNTKGNVTSDELECLLVPENCK